MAKQKISIFAPSKSQIVVVIELPKAFRSHLEELSKSGLAAVLTNKSINKMAKIIPNDLIKGVSGKVCGHSDLYYSMNKTSGVVHTGKRCNPYEGPASEKQLAQQAKFAVQTSAAAAWLRANRPSETNGANGTNAYQQAQALKRRLCLSNVRQVIYKYMDATGKVTLPGGETGNANVNPNPNPGGQTGGGGSSSGGGSDDIE